MNKKRISIFIGLIVILLISSFGFYNISLQAVQKVDNPVSFTVVEGDNLTSISNKLAEKNYIKSAMAAKVYGKLNKVNGFVVGNFEINQSWSTPEILNYLLNPSHIISNEATVTLIEGDWAKDIAYKLSQKLDVSSEELLTLWNDRDYVSQLIEDYEVLTDDILNDEFNVLLEGYLAPNTYNFYIEASADDITRKLLNQTEAIYQKYKADFDASEYSIHEIFTLASITQYESGSYEDDQIIAGVWYNRLDLGMKLESSVTVCYSLYEYENWKDCETNTRIDSPYNTYVYAGIPIGPILNPGEMSIKATLNPKDTDYLFFIADVYGDNTIYYAKTFEEHSANVNKYLR